MIKVTPKQMRELQRAMKPKTAVALKTRQRRVCRFAQTIAFKVVRKGTCIIIDLPIRTVSELNRSGSQHWRIRDQRTDVQRSSVRMLLHGVKLPALPAEITFTRLSSRTLDAGDNLNSAFKHVRDELAALYDVDDSSSLYQWQPCKQERSRAAGVRIEIVSVTP